MQAKVQKWGNSLAVRIPRAFASQAHLAQDTLVDLSLRDGEVVISACNPPYTLAALLDKVTAQNTHGEQDTGPAVGAEEWV